MPGPQRESNHTSTGYCRKPAGRIYAAPTTQQKQKEAVAQGKNPSAAASLRLNASRSTKTLAIDPLISKKQITQTGPSE